MGGISSSQKKEHVDSANNDSKNSSIPLMISNPKVLDCCSCFQPLSIPVYQCDNGHIVCSTCGPKLRNKCHICSLFISSKCCKVIENLLMSVEISCSNAKYGCREKISYIGTRKHEKKCTYAICYCPISGCGFVSASSKVLSNHFSHKHGDSQFKFSYDQSFIVSLKSNVETFALHEENDGKIFIFNNSTIVLGNAVNICFIDFLVISFASSEPRKIEICITPMIQIFIKYLDGRNTSLRVKSSDTVMNVKKMILDKDNIKVHQQRLIFGRKHLEDDKTLDNYNIQNKSTILLVKRLCGN
ncbi:E3 ubiquitin-protein ligase SINA [Trifolium repens]|nr:E3 ubiquitin-protein ligase SINA [Trifolium repens]